PAGARSHQAHLPLWRPRLPVDGRPRERSEGHPGLEPAAFSKCDQARQLAGLQLQSKFVSGNCPVLYLVIRPDGPSDNIVGSSAMRGRSDLLSLSAPGWWTRIAAGP